MITLCYYRNVWFIILFVETNNYINAFTYLQRKERKKEIKQEFSTCNNTYYKSIKCH